MVFLVCLECACFGVFWGVFGVLRVCFRRFWCVLGCFEVFWGVFGVLRVCFGVFQHAHETHLNITQTPPYTP